MRYEMEELVPVVGKLAERYTAYESTSMTWERAGQLMEAVLYCIAETEQAGEGALPAAEGMTAREAYEAGAACVEKKTRRALELYNALLPEFCHYGNDCLYDTVVRQLPEFFKWYDIRFAPQETIVTLDYPVRKDLSAYAGIDKIYEFIKCIDAEQKFLRRFSGERVAGLLARYEGDWKGAIENVCEVVLRCVEGEPE